MPDHSIHQELMQKKNALLFFRIIIFIGIGLFINALAFGQTTNKPPCTAYGDRALYVEKVVLTAENTIVYLSYHNVTGKDIYLELDPYTAIKEKHSANTYSMLRLTGLAISPEKTVVRNRVTHQFSITFPPLSAGCYEFDLFECPREGCFNITGIKINNDLVDASGKKDKRFQREYNLVTVYDMSSKKWSEWVKGNYVFIFNLNDQNDFKLYLSDGKEIMFSMLSNPKYGTEGGKNTFQYMDVKDEKNNKATLKLYDSGDAALIYEVGEAYQFSNQ